MLKPDLKEIQIGTIFQISPDDKTDPISIRHGGDFLILNDLDDIFETGMRGYLGVVSEGEDLRRHRGLAFMTVRWNLLEIVGKVEWIQLKVNDS
jgi:hypothetical protein